MWKCSSFRLQVHLLLGHRQLPSVPVLGFPSCIRFGFCLEIADIHLWLNDLFEKKIAAKSRKRAFGLAYVSEILSILHRAVANDTCLLLLLVSVQYFKAEDVPKTGSIEYANTTNYLRRNIRHSYHASLRLVDIESLLLTDAISVKIIHI